MRASIEQVQGIMAARKRMYAIRRPGIIAILSHARIQRLLEAGIAGSVRCRMRFAAAAARLPRPRSSISRP